MQCHLCKAKTDVIDTRLQRDGGVKRRRQCQDCNTRFTSIERLQDTSRIEQESASQPTNPKATHKPTKVVSKKLTPGREREGGFQLENVWNKGAAYEDLREIDISFNRDDE